MDFCPYALCPISPCKYKGRGIEKDRQGNREAKKQTYYKPFKYIHMTRTEFFLKACIAFATNSKLIRDNLTTDQHVSNIHYFAKKLTAKVEESADFDPEHKQ